VSSPEPIAQPAPCTAQAAAPAFAWSEAEWQAAREVRLRSRAAQGLPELVEDIVAIQRAADLLRS
jgi:hypothetical protein